MGLGLSILVSLITIFSIGIYLIFGKNLPYNLAKYSGQGLSLEYPSHWTLSSYEPNTFNPVFAQLLAPNSGNNKVFPSKLVLEIIHLSQPSSLEEITEQTIQEIKQFLPNATLIENQKITLAGSQAYQLIYTGEEEQELIKRKQVGILDNNKLYVMTYEAKIDQYSQYEKLADKIMNSVQLLP